MSSGYFVPGKGWVSEKEPEPSPEYGAPDELLGTPVILNYRGEPTEFFKISALADALNRSVVTIRKWEDRKFLPKATFGLPSGALGGRIRLYTRDQVMGLREIARAEGLLDDLTKNVTRTEFTSKANFLFNRKEEK